MTIKIKKSLRLQWKAFTTYIYTNRHLNKARIGKFSNFAGKIASLVGFGWTYLGIVLYFGLSNSSLLDWLYQSMALLAAGLTSWGMYYGVKIATDNYTQYSELNKIARKSASTLFLIICSIVLTAFSVWIQTYTNIPLLGPFVNSHIPALNMQLIAVGFSTIFTLSIATGAINQGHRYWTNRKPDEEDDCCKSQANVLNTLGNFLNMAMSIAHICFVIPSGMGLALGIIYALSDWVIHQLNSSILFGTKEKPRPELANTYFGLVIFINLISRTGLGISVYGGVFLLCSAISCAFPPLLVFGAALFFASIAGTAGFLYSYNQAYEKWCQLKGLPFDEETQQPASSKSPLNTETSVCITNANSQSQLEPTGFPRSSTNSSLANLVINTTTILTRNNNTSISPATTANLEEVHPHFAQKLNA